MTKTMAVILQRKGRLLVAFPPARRLAYEVQRLNRRVRA